MNHRTGWAHYLDLKIGSRGIGLSVRIRGCVGVGGIKRAGIAGDMTRAGGEDAEEEE